MRASRYRVCVKESSVRTMLSLQTWTARRNMPCRSGDYSGGCAMIAKLAVVVAGIGVVVGWGPADDPPPVAAGDDAPKPVKPQGGETTKERDNTPAPGFIGGENDKRG